MVQQKNSKTRLHGGKAMLQVASTYPTLLLVILEIVQNFLDEAAQQARILINRKTRRVVVEENGNGTDQSHFEAALQSICDSEKSRDKLGRFGIGLISPLGKCDSFTFCSTPRDNPHGYTEWTFSTREIAEQYEPTIPMSYRPELFWSKSPRSNNKRTEVWWRTKISLDGVVFDRIISAVSLPTLKSEILAKFNEPLLRLGTVISVKIVDEDGNIEEGRITGEKFSGRPLPTFICGDVEEGVSRFALFLTRKSARKGGKARIVLGESDNQFRVPLAQFLRSLPEVVTPPKDVTEALSSGVFEGEITNSLISLHQNRRGFNVNDALVNFCIHLQTWYEEAGKTQLASVREEQEDERLQTLGARSLEVFKHLLNNPLGASLLSTIKSFTYGHTGEQHFPGKAKRDGLTDDPAITAGVSRGKGGEQPRSAKGEPKGDHPEHKPLAVTGPRGQKRRFVKSDSLGLVLEYDILPGAALYELDSKMGVLRLNVRHPLFAQCKEHSDRALMKFQEFLMGYALYSLSCNEQVREYLDLGMDDFFKIVAFLSMYSDSLSARQSGRSSSTKARPPKGKGKSATASVESLVLKHSA